ncbi:hypothetical protein ACFL29_01325 [Patescibacteria group bacterium]
MNGPGKKKTPAKKKAKQTKKKKVGQRLTKEQLAHRQFVKKIQTKLNQSVDDKKTAEIEITLLEQKIQDKKNSIKSKECRQDDLKTVLRIAREDCDHKFDERIHKCIYCDFHKAPPVLPTSTFTF